MATTQAVEIFGRRAAITLLMRKCTSEGDRGRKSWFFYLRTDKKEALEKDTKK
jgi:hypothetical protein